MGVANSVAAQIGNVSDQSDDGQAAGLAATETQSQHGFDTAVGIDVLLVIGSHIRGLVKRAGPVPASAKPENRARRLLARDIFFPALLN